jgi:hypothetical protein
MTPVLICLIIFGSFASLFIVPRYFKNREREKMQDTIRAAIDKGQTLPPDLIEAMTRDVRPTSSAQRDIRLGVIWLAIAVGLGALGYAAGDYTDDGAQATIALAAIPGVIGIAFIVLSFFNKNKR